MNTHFLLRKPCSNKTYGIEIECLIPAQSHTGFDEYKNFFYSTRDGSLRRDNYNQLAIEFVSQPLTQDFLKRAITKLYSSYSDVRANDSCGIHIHVSRKWCSEKKAAGIAAFINCLTYAQCQDLFGRGPNDYWSREMSTASRYVAVNRTNKETVEFRMFKSGGCGWAKYCVDMAAYLVEHWDHLNLDAMYAFRDLKFKEYNL